MKRLVTGRRLRRKVRGRKGGAGRDWRCGGEEKNGRRGRDREGEKEVGHDILGDVVSNV